MKNFGLWKFVFLFVLSVYGCGTYKSVQDGYMVRGDENFKSEEANISVFLGPLITTDLWNSVQKMPLKVGKLPRHQSNLLQKFGYEKKSPTTILFYNAADVPYSLVGALSSLGNEDQRSRPTFTKYRMDVLQLSKKTTPYGKWYYEIKEMDKSSVYRAVIPVSEKLFHEKYLTLICELPKGSDWTKFEDLILQNAQHFQTPGFYPSNMPLMNCGDSDPDLQHMYQIPAQLLNKNKEFIVKAFKKDQIDSLVFFTKVASPPFTRGAFKICPGEYTIQFTSLDGTVIHSYDFSL